LSDLEEEKAERETKSSERKRMPSGSSISNMKNGLKLSRMRRFEIQLQEVHQKVFSPPEMRISLHIKKMTPLNQD